MFRQIVIPTEKNHLITLPEDLYGKQVEVIAFELDRNKTTSANKKNFLADIDAIPDFPSIEQIRKGEW